MVRSDDSQVVRYTYRLRCSVTARARLLAEWDRCRWVWNRCVAESREAYLACQPCGPAGLDKKLTNWRGEHEWLRAGASVPQQQAIRDFAKSRAKALADIKSQRPTQQRAGMPKFKKKDLAPPSLNYTKRGFRITNGRLHLAGGIELGPIWSRALPAHPSSARVYRDTLGDWYVSFVISVSADRLPETGRAIGIDWGVTETATTTSHMHDLPHSEHGKKAAVELARYQRMMARRRPPKGRPASNRYKYAKRCAAQAYAKVARQRADDARKWAKRVVRDFDRIAVEDFRPKFLTKTTMARKAADAAIAVTKTALIAMGRKHAREVKLVHPAHTTMDCGKCLARTKHRLPLSQRIYSCTACGFVSPRDKNSAHVVLARAGFNPAGVDCGSPDRSPSGQAA
ncbi:RNA-guided endonuclease InsQ/TnpB family protein [Nocardia acididurans]|uniref:RNA-guided endonuclease InsQ/TnpB family protein n=1 Tax=Nocardia acididurans TaxID=2802282 RepID=UPI001E4AA765